MRLATPGAVDPRADLPAGGRPGSEGRAGSAPRMRPEPPRRSRAERLRAPLLLGLAVLLALEAVGGIVIFFARLAWGGTPGETLHVLAGAALAGVYAVYQWRHWGRVAPLRARLDHALGLLASGAMATTLLTGFVLAVPWWRARVEAASAAPVIYPPALSAVHNIGSMLLLTFVLTHVAAVLMRDRRVSSR